MARGHSGRIVIEVDPATKHSLYVALAKQGLTLKGWFLREVGQYLHAQGEEVGRSKPPDSEQPEAKEGQR